ncbi:caspase-1-like protein [Leptotrombidium deliense]|uniref:Caspase-1-like protein n=1 Tax=Leptotrombidium deliense TaxID=299467 RepID=A0A443SHX8_9ACAR|nr:caspase-1-like protein [Leptotrombidium deliense]
MEPEVDSSEDASAIRSIFSGVLCGATANVEDEQYEKIAVLTTEADSPVYNMTRKRGICLILNHHTFRKQLSKRRGTVHDKKALIRCFTRLGYQIMHFDDLEFSQIVKILRDIARMDHTAADSFVCCVLTHGEDGLLHAYDHPYESQELYNRFKGDVCTSLCGKPKIFIIQACQGFRYDHHVVIVSDSRDEPDSRKYHTIPTMADFLIALSTVPGYFSWRDLDRGSWYIQRLVEALEENHAKKDTEKEDLVSILTTVNRRVAYDAGVQATQSILYKQMPCFQSTLTRKVTFPSIHQ